MDIAAGKNSRKNELVHIFKSKTFVGYKMYNNRYIQTMQNSKIHQQ